MPVIIVDTYIPGLANFIEEIEQEVMVMFDEFDKTFGGVNKSDGMADPQTELLTLFDGLAQGKKLYVITCNNLNTLSDYLVNRPGRFHYHFRLIIRQILKLQNICETSYIKSIMEKLVR